MIRSADDKAVVSNTQTGLQQLMDDLNKMKINAKKTKVMCISCKENCRIKIQIDGQLLE